MIVILIRHGETPGNRMRRYIGRTDEPLCGDVVLPGAYPEADGIVSSPLKRCVMTAELIYPGRDIKLCSDLRETDFGEFENRSYEELKDNPDYKHWLASGGTIPFPGGEGPEDFRRRVIAAYDGIVTETRADTLAVITHGGTIMAIMQHVFGGKFYDYQVPNLGGYVLDLKNLTYCGLFNPQKNCH